MTAIKAAQPTPTVGMLPVFNVADWYSAGVDDYGCQWILENCKGWDDTPPVRLDMPVRAGADGRFPAPGRYDAKVITLSGACVAPDRAASWAAKRRLAQVAADLINGAALVGTMPDGVGYQVRCRRSEAWKLIHLGNTGFRYEAVVTAADPCLYSDVLHQATATLTDSSGATGGAWKFTMSWPYGFAGTGVTPGQFTVVNQGNYPTWPDITVFGPGTNLTLHHQQTNRSLVVTSLAADQYVRLDSKNRQVLLMNTSSRRDLLTPDSQWFPLLPGTNNIAFYAATFTAAYVLLSWRDAWL